MADVKLQAVITAKDEASAKINSISSSLGGIATKLGVMGIAAVGAGIAVAGVFIKKSIDAAKEEEVAMAKVEAIAKSMGFTMADLSPIIDEASKKAIQLGFDDEDAAIAMAKLFQITGDEGVAMNALTVSMDLARFKGIDLDSATQAITLAYAGNTRMLKQLGIEVPDNASKQEVLGLIMEKVKGQAEAYGNTLAGAQEKAKESFENLQEEVGKIFLPIITDLFTKINNFISSDKLKGWIETIKEFFNTKFMPAMAAVAKFIKEVLWPALMDNIVPAFQKAYEAIKPHLPLLADIAKWIGIIVGGAVVGALIAVAYNITSIVGSFAKMIDVIKDIIDWIKKLVDWFKTLGDKIPDWLKSSPFETIKGLVGLQAGGYVAGGRPYIVGERGPELFMPSGSGQIIPNNKMGGAININFNNPVVRSENDLSRIISEVKRVLNREQVLAGLRI